MSDPTPAATPSAESSSTPAAGLSPTAERTRTMIMTAAIDLLATRPEAPMTDVAEAAGVSRSTLHRYFPDRPALRTALGEHVTGQWRDAVRRARLGEGTGLEAFRRLCAELMDRIDVLAWWMLLGENGENGGEGPTADQGDPEDEAIAGAIARGRDDGSIDPAMTPEWLSACIWAVLYTVRFLPRVGPMTDFDARQHGMRTLLKTAAADPGSV